jgi:hypothetical protein
MCALGALSDGEHGDDSRRAVDGIGPRRAAQDSRRLAKRTRLVNIVRERAVRCAAKLGRATDGDGILRQSQGHSDHQSWMVR